MNVLLVEPEFPIATKSKNHRDFLPIGLLKIGSYHKLKGDRVKLATGMRRCGFRPDRVLITSLFTYWSKYVHDVGLYEGGEAEKVKINYSLLPEELDYQIIHSTRGCLRKCKFCGTWKIEPEFTYKESISAEICSNKLVFYDNNLLANPHIRDILKYLAKTIYNDRVIHSESQCGIDGRLLTPALAKLLKNARFDNPRIAWDGSYKQHKFIKRQIDMLAGAGYSPKNIYVFMVYNFDIGYSEMVKKLKACEKWGVQIADCRFRPLNQTFDNYSPRRKQTKEDYYIHDNWTDRRIRLFRKKVREQNIMVRHGFSFYSRELERAGGQKSREKRGLKIG